MVAPRYALVETMHGGRAKAYEKRRPKLGPSAMIDCVGNEITAFNYGSLHRCNCGRVSCTRLDTDQGVVLDCDGNELFEDRWGDINDYVEDRACVRIWRPAPGVPQVCGFIDLGGNVVVPVEQTYYGRFYDVVTVVVTRDKADRGRLIDVNNNTLYTPGNKSDWKISDYSGGLIYAMNLRTNERQLTNTKGEVVVPPHPEYSPNMPPTGYENGIVG
ncbi:MAG: hypothetical protein AAF911_00910 [Planctomycetota bacterium]